MKLCAPGGALPGTPSAPMAFTICCAIKRGVRARLRGDFLAANPTRDMYSA
ncbi:MAG: hypothetical protein ABSC94_25380 [Polyangiaceae bacterium]